MQVIDVNVQDGHGLISVAVTDIMTQTRLLDYFKWAEKLADEIELLREQCDAWKTEAEHQYGLVRASKFDEIDYPVEGALDAYAAGKYPVLKVPNAEVCIPVMESMPTNAGLGSGER